MSYATQADLEGRFGAAAVSKAALGGSATGVTDAAPRIATALSDAAAEIDAALAASFALPLATTKTWPGLRAIQCDIAQMLLFGQSVPDAVRDRARDARSRLGLIASGARQLLDGDGTALERRDQPRTADELPGVEAKAMVMTDDNLEGF